MSYTNNTQDPDQDQSPQTSLTFDDLSELHGIAHQLQAAGDPRAQKLWNLIGAHTGDGSEMPKFTLTQSPMQTTSWEDDLGKLSLGRPQRLLILGSARYVHYLNHACVC